GVVPRAVRKSYPPSCSGTVAPSHDASASQAKENTGGDEERGAEEPQCAMRKNRARPNSLREGLKAKGRLRRESARKQAEAARALPRFRNDLLPVLKVESLPSYRRFLVMA